jgi:hypothetical protein
MRRAPAAAVAVVVALSLAACGATEDDTSTGPTGAVGSSSAPGTTEPTPTDSTSASRADPSDDDGADAIEIEIAGDRIQPNGKRVAVAAGEEVTFAVKADRAAELHVHSSPEQVLPVQEGESTIRLVIERPGIVDVEEHETGLVVVQLEVR